MTVFAEKAISFKCEKCGHVQFVDDTLEEGIFLDMPAMQDHIYCEKCGHENHVIKVI